jgi:hypothetical protein
MESDETFTRKQIQGRFEKLFGRKMTAEERASLFLPPDDNEQSGKAVQPSPEGDWINASSISPHKLNPRPVHFLAYRVGGIFLVREIGQRDVEWMVAQPLLNLPDVDASVEPSRGARLAESV